MTVSDAELTGRVLLDGWRASSLSKRDYWRTLDCGLTYNAMIGRMWRAERGMVEQPHVFQHDLGAPWRLPHDDYVIVGDVQLPTSSYDFIALPMAVAREHLRKGHRNLVLAGDLLNADAFSIFESDVETPAFQQEIDACRVFFAEYLTVFDRIWWITGNHERRVGKRTRGAIKPAHMLAMMTHDPRVEVSHWGHCVIANERGHDWRISHARNYSVNQLVVADQLAQKYQQHVIQHHEHHCAMGWDRYGRYIVINGGGLFDQNQMGYVVLDDSKSPTMKRGFTLLKNGTAHLLSDEPFTDWSMWLPDGKRKVLQFPQAA